MSVLFSVVTLLLSLFVLVKSSDVSIKSCVKFARLTKISELSVGFIFLAVITSLPELSIGIISSLKREGLLSVGNVIGSNIANLCLVMGTVSYTHLTLPTKA